MQFGFKNQNTESKFPPNVKITTSDLLSFIPNNQLYMVCPYTEETVELLNTGEITEEDDERLMRISDEFEKTPLGRNTQIQVVKAFGAIMYNSYYEYEDHYCDYILILVDPDG